MDPIKINCNIGSRQCDIYANEIECSGHNGPCFELLRDSVVLGRICKTVNGMYIHIGHSDLTQDDLDAVGEQIDGGYYGSQR